MITDDARCENEIKVRTAIAKLALSRKQELLARTMKLELKKRIVKTLVWTVLLYGAETWMLRKEDIRRLEAYEMWFWRKILKISWKDRITNEDVLQKVGETRLLIGTIVKRKKGWIGHVLRGNGMLKEII